MQEETIVHKAEFNRKVCSYWLLSGALILTVTIVGIPLLIFWFVFGLWITRRYLARMECVLTNRALKVRKGILVRVEKTVPLDKITDMGMIQGPIMRAFDLEKLTVETAGQSGEGALIALTGIVDAPSFREQVLKQRDELNSASVPISVQHEPDKVDQNSKALLADIKASLLRIENIISRNIDT